MSTLTVADRVQETTTTTGTGNLTMLGAVTGYQSFNTAVASGNLCNYCIQDLTNNAWEVGLGTFTSTETLARTTVIASSNSGSLVSFAAGTKQVFLTMPASDFNGTFNVMGFGATGNGSTDDTAAVQKAVNACYAAGGGTVYFPTGNYVITPVSATVPAITIPSNVTLAGANRGSYIQTNTSYATTILKNGNGILFDFSGIGPSSQTVLWNQNQGLRDMFIDCQSHTGLCLRLYYLQFYYEQNLYIDGNNDVAVDMVQCWDSRFLNSYYGDGGSASSSTISGGQACTHLMRCSAAPATTLSAGISGVITALPVAALPAALPAGIVQVWNGAGQYQNFVTTGAALSATSIPVTSATVLYTFISTDVVNGFGYSTDSTNACMFTGCHWEDSLSGAIWITSGVDSTKQVNQMFFHQIKIEEDSVGYNCPLVQIDAGADAIFFDGLYGYCGGFNAGYSTAVPFIQWKAADGGISNSMFAMGNAPAPLTTCLLIENGTPAYPTAISNVYMYFNVAPTLGGGVDVVAGSGANIFNCVQNCGATLTNPFFGSGVINLYGGNQGYAQMNDEWYFYGGLTLGAGSTALPAFGLTAGTNLTTATAGATEYDGVNHYFTNDTTSGRGLVPVEQYFHLTSAGSGITTIANFFGATSNISLVSGAYYEIEICCYFTMGSTASVVTWTLTNSAAPTYMDLEYRMSPITGIVAPPGTATELVGQIIGGVTAAQTVVTGSLTLSSKQYAKFKIQLKNSTGTSLKIQATETTTTTALVPDIGSYWKCKRISPNNIGTFAA